MRCGVHVVTKIHHCGGAARACSRVIADFRFFDSIFRLWATFTRPFWPRKLSLDGKREQTGQFLFIFVLKYAVPRLQAAARTLQLVCNLNFHAVFYLAVRHFGPALPPPMG